MVWFVAYSNHKFNLSVFVCWCAVMCNVVFEIWSILELTYYKILYHCYTDINLSLKQWLYFMPPLFPLCLVLSSSLPIWGELILKCILIYFVLYMIWKFVNRVKKSCTLIKMHVYYNNNRLSVMIPTSTELYNSIPNILNSSYNNHVMKL